MKLNRTGSNWNELERNKINENWDIIEGGYNDVVGQITDEVVGHLIDSAKLIWKEPVGTEADLPKNAEVGETRMVRESVGGVSHVYRYNGTKWELVQEIDATLVNEVDKRLTAQLAETEQEIKSKEIIPLYINTFEGSNEPYHPSVVYFEDGWNGYKYWMAYTPYPKNYKALYMDRWECPSIAVSNDGFKWTIPEGFKNPLQDLTSEQINRRDFFSDPSITMVGNTMEIWYRHTDGSNTSNTNILRVTSTDGVNWSDPEIVQNSRDPDNGIGGVDRFMRSQSVIYKDGKYIAIFGGGLQYAESTDPRNGWTNHKNCTLNGGPNGYPWHMGVIYEDGIFHLTGYYSRDPESIEYYTSEDGVNYYHKKTLISATDDRKFSNLNSLYQAVPVKISDDEWRLYSSCDVTIGNLPRNGLLVMQGRDLLALSLVNPNRYNNIIQNDIILPTTPGRTNSNPRRIVFNVDDELNYLNSIGVRGRGEKARLTHYYYDEKDGREYFNTFNSSMIANATLPNHFHYIGETYISLSDPESFYVCTAEGKWIHLTELMLFATGRKNVSLDSVISCNRSYRVVVNTISKNVPIEKINGYVEGQDIIIVNVLLDDIVLKNGIGGYGSMRLKGGVDRTLGRFDAIKLHNLNNIWYEI